MLSQQVWGAVKELPKERVRSLVDDAEAVLCGTPNAEAYQAARYLLQAVKVQYPDLVAVG